jgi:hypothetical protein
MSEMQTVRAFVEDGRVVLRTSREEAWSFDGASARHLGLELLAAANELGFAVGFTSDGRLVPMGDEEDGA